MAPSSKWISTVLFLIHWIHSLLVPKMTLSCITTNSRSPWLFALSDDKKKKEELISQNLQWYHSAPTQKWHRIVKFLLNNRNQKRRCVLKQQTQKATKNRNLIYRFNTNTYTQKLKSKTDTHEICDTRSNFHREVRQYGEKKKETELNHTSIGEEQMIPRESEIEWLVASLISVDKIAFKPIRRFLSLDLTLQCAFSWCVFFVWKKKICRMKTRRYSTLSTDVDLKGRANSFLHTTSSQIW